MSIFSSLGRIVLSFLYDLYEIGVFVLSSVNTLLFRFTAGRRAISSIIYKQIYFTGIEAFPIISWTAISVFVLTFYFEVITILGGYLLAGFGKRITLGVYISSVLETMGFADIIASLLKSVVFGLIIGAVSAMHGMRVRRSITEIPQQTTKAVISSLFLVFVVDGIITAVFFM